MKEWAERLGVQQYHGGENPDEADFVVNLLIQLCTNNSLLIIKNQMYGVLKAKHNSKSFQRFIERDFPDKTYKWFVRMQINCKYEDRMLFNE